MDFHGIEEKWQRAWEEGRAFQPEMSDRKKFFITIPYPYLNGNLHAGHTRTFTIGDAVARYKRMLGYNVLFPMGFHVTGTPIIGLAELIAKRDERTVEVYTKYHDVPFEELVQLTTPEKIVEYFSREAEKALKIIGYSIDWRRKFTTMDETYQKFIEWQYWKLKEKGLIVKGSHPVRYCPNDDNPVEDHDLLAGEDATIVEFTVIKFRIDDLVLPAATLRPETVFGVTNLWLKPSTYAVVEVNGEKWVVSREAYEKLRFTDKNIRFLEDLEASRLFGKYAVNPVTGTEVPVLPAGFVDPDNATGVVMSVPAHAPFDYVALKDLEKSDLLEKYGISKDILKDIRPIVLIEIEGEDFEIPAKDVVEELGVESQNDVELLEKATKMVYKKEFHKGVMLENTGRYAGLRVSIAKDRVHEDLVNSGNGDVFFEFSEKPVICRCGTKCVVKVVRDQWFLNYSNPEWKEKVLEWLEEMAIIPDYYKEEFRNKIEWLKDKACARRKGLGTRIPWDREWLIESLSDSTVYMAYYIIARYINDGSLRAENLIPEFFDYVFLGKGDVGEVAEKTGLDADFLEKLRVEFNYWYPVDLRSSGKDLVANHLLFFLFHHIALFPKDYWPRAIAVNGFVSLEGKKMSKSKGPLLTLKRAVKEFGADVTRLYILHASEYESDADWKRKEVENVSTHLRRFYSLAEKYYLKEPGEITGLDRWLVSKFQKIIRETREAMDALQTRRAINTAFFEAMNVVRWYLRRGGENLTIIFDDWLKLLTPFIPHLCEEIWHWKHDTFISLESYPEYDETRVDEEAEIAEEYLKSLIDDINEVKKFIENPERVYIVFAEEWKRKAVEAAQNAGSLKDAMKELMKDDRLRTMAREVQAFLKRIFREGFELANLDEERIVKGAKDFIERETGLAVEFDISKVPEQKRKVSMPGKPAIYIE
ncbi:leucine--tRNA ligase [Geoglobus acetivorans]|uniref:Leucine--tRNA ligase n=1 Tax=Geoglobus acetivorans TaxID=565033 RepID=A0ABZ3H2K4_GEOAI|nr:leucine--tRNA ligase [Geoglobus acetivorans]